MCEYEFTVEGAKKFRELITRPNPKAAETVRRAKEMIPCRTKTP